jgi:hypothetical protein
VLAAEPSHKQLRIWACSACAAVLRAQLGGHRCCLTWPKTGAGGAQLGFRNLGMYLKCGSTTWHTTYSWNEPSPMHADISDLDKLATSKAAKDVHFATAEPLSHKCWQQQVGQWLMAVYACTGKQLACS